jgi:hypothetical protein
VPEVEGPAAEMSAAEREIIRSFGWNLIATENTLYERYLRISVRSSLSTINEFRNCLKELEARGFLSVHDVKGLKFYRLMAAVDGVRDAALPETPLDEMKLAVGTLKAQPPIETSVSPSMMDHAIIGPIEEAGSESDAQRVSRRNIARCEYIGRRLQRALEYHMLTANGRISKAKINLHSANMWKALCQSEEALLKYVEEEIPGLYREVVSILDADGSDLLMLGLRLVDTKTKKYR